MMETVYQTKVSVTGGRNGKIKSNDGILELDVRIPVSMGGKGGATNPEQLFAAGYAACFDSALNYIALQNKQRIKSETEVSVELKSSKEEGFCLAVTIVVSIEGTDRDTAQKLVEQAHQFCPYSKATRNNIEISVNIK